MHYRVDPTLRDKIAPSTNPGLFAGFRYDSGPKSFKGVLFVLDYEKVKNRAPGYAIPIAVPTEEVWVDDKQPPQLPLKRAAETALANFDQPKLEDIQPLDIPFSAIDGVTTPRTHNEHITMDRVYKFGATPGCRGCEFEATKHTPLCRARFNALIRADRIAKAPKTPPVVPAEPDGSRATGDADPGGSHEEAASAEHVEQGAVGKVVDAIDLRFLERRSVMNHARRIATATEMPGKNVLFEYAGHVDSKAEQAVSEIGAKCIKLASDVVDPMNKDHVKQVAGQLQQLKGSDLWVNLSFVERHKGKHQANRKRAKIRYATHCRCCNFVLTIMAE